MSSPTLDGFTVGITADRRWEEQAELFARRGVSVLHGPSIRTRPLTSEPALRAVTEELITHPPDIVVANTAIGMRAWFSAAESDDLDDRLHDRLARARIVARGPKAAAAVHAVGLDVDWRAPTATMRELRAFLLAEGVQGRRIALQRDGGTDAPLADELRAAGADVVEVPVYHWELPDDPRPAARLVEAAIDGRIQAVTFTSGPGVRNLMSIAAEAGLDDGLRAALAGPVAAVCVGPVCADTARGLGIDHALEPGRARLGPMVRLATEQLRGQVADVDIDGWPIVVRGVVVESLAGRCELTPTEARLLVALVARPGAVVAKSSLMTRVWGPQANDPHVVEVTAGRLRRRLAPVGVTVESVPRRGYRVGRATMAAAV